MKRWLIALVLPVLSCVLIIAHRGASATLLQDTDTAVLLRTIREANAPFSWFTSDWPLKNHFYRPLSTLSFELDNKLYGDWAPGYGLTNALLAVACVLLLFWLVRELTDVPWMAAAAAAVFGLWHTVPGPIPVLPVLTTVLAAIAALGSFRSGWKAAALGSATLGYLATLWEPAMDLGFRIVGWLPGRTASTMTVFALIALASYGRYERLVFRPEPSEPTSLDKPATKGTVVVKPSPRAGNWISVSWLGLVGALLCYEQAVMLPAVLLGWAIVVRLRGGKPHWLVHLVFWSTLFTYLLLRSRFVPPGVSGYQAQQFRSGAGVVLSIADYSLPAWNLFAILVTMLGAGWVMLLALDPWKLVWRSLGNLVSWILVWRHDSRWTTMYWWLAALVSFLPMAWLQPFGHYHYWPSAFRAVFVVALGKVAFDGWLTAVSPRAIQAPPRPHPAPGSLLRP